MTAEPDRSIARWSGSAAEVLDHRRLGFLDPEVETGFRAAERDRNLNQARFALTLAILVNLAFAGADPWVYADHLGAVFAIRTVGLTAVLVALQGCNYLTVFRTRWPVLLTLAVFAFTATFAAMNAITHPPAMIVAGFVSVVLGSYILLPLIFMYCVRAVWIATIAYLAATAYFDVLAGQNLVMLAMQLIGANIIGMFALYRSERFRRLDYLNTLRIAEQRQRHRDLLVSILPAAVADRLERGETVVDAVDDGAVLFADIVGFTELASRNTAEDVLALLNRLYATFDALVERHGLEKIKTIGDSYMVAGGVPEPAADHLAALADLALAMRDAAARIRTPEDSPVALRIGFHSGPLTAGVIGDKRFLYDIWGDTVNTASRMEELGAPDMIHVSESVQQQLKDRFAFAARGVIDVKGKGRMPTWYLTGRRTDAAAAE